MLPFLSRHIKFLKSIMILSFSVSRLFQPLMPLMIVSYILVIFPYPYGMKIKNRGVARRTCAPERWKAYLPQNAHASFGNKKAEQDLFSPLRHRSLFSLILPLFQRNPENKCIHASDQEVTSCVTEKVVWNTAIFASIGAGRRFRNQNQRDHNSMNSAFTTDPAAMPAISPPFPLHFFVTSPTPRTRRALPAMIHGMIAGMAPMIGLPVIKNDVTGVITERIMPQGIPTLNTAKIRHALMTGPVI